MSEKENKTAGMAELMKRLDCPQFELLARRFTTAPAGIARAHQKQALLLFVAKVADEVAKAGDESK